MKKREHPEDIIQRAVCDHLRSRAWPDVVWFHVPNGARLGGKRTKKGFPIQAARLKGLGVRSGVSDLILFYKGELFVLELKVLGGRATVSQLEFISDIQRTGGHAVVAEGLDEAIAILECWGLLRGTSIYNHPDFALVQNAGTG